MRQTFTFKWIQLLNRFLFRIGGNWCALGYRQVEQAFTLKWAQWLNGFMVFLIYSTVIGRSSQSLCKFVLINSTMFRHGLSIRVNSTSESCPLKTMILEEWFRAAYTASNIYMGVSTRNHQPLREIFLNLTKLLGFVEVFMLIILVKKSFGFAFVFPHT